MAFYNKYIIHKTKSGERWDDLARIYYGDCFRYAPIVKANPDIPISPFLPADTEIIVPIVETRVQNIEGLPIWKQ